MITGGMAIATYFSVALFPQNEEPGRLPAFSTEIAAIVECPEPLMSLGPTEWEPLEPENDSD